MRITPALFTLLIFVFSGCSTPTSNHGIERAPENFRSCLEIMSEMMLHKSISDDRRGFYTEAQSLSELEELYGTESLIDIQKRLQHNDILLNNENVKKLLSERYTVDPIEGKFSSISLAESQVIYDAMENAKVNKDNFCYDPQGSIGFCFGRATIAHMEALARKVHPEAIKKIWIAGDMGFWGHHVATMVYTKRGWRVLDTNNGKPLTVNAWIAHYWKTNKKDVKEVMVFVTQAGRYGPYDNRPYSALDLFNTENDEFDKARDYFKGYFHDYFDSLDKVKPVPFQRMKK